jgi:hypothetical protein
VTNFLLILDTMPKAVKERPRHAASLGVQLQNDRDPVVSDSKRAKRKRKAAEDGGELDNGESVISGKLGRQILAIAREQQEEADEDQESEQDEELGWRENQL